MGNHRYNSFWVLTSRQNGKNINIQKYEKTSVQSVFVLTSESFLLTTDLSDWTDLIIEGTVFQTVSPIWVIYPETLSRVTLASLGIAFQAKTTKQQKISTNKNNKIIIIYFSSCFYLLMFIRHGGTVFQTAVSIRGISPETSSRVTLASLGIAFQAKTTKQPNTNRN